jgi:hypothetical protein
MGPIKSTHNVLPLGVSPREASATFRDTRIIRRGASQRDRGRLRRLLLELERGIPVRGFRGWLMAVRNRSCMVLHFDTVCRVAKRNASSLVTEDPRRYCSIRYSIWYNTRFNRALQYTSKYMYCTVLVQCEWRETAILSFHQIPAKGAVRSAFNTV